MKIYEITDSLPEKNEKKILVYTGSYNLITLARKNETAYKLYKQLISRDYILYFHDKGVSRFYQRKYVNELWQRKDLIKYNELYYTITPPIDRKINKNSEKKLLVIFPCMPDDDNYDNCLIPKRMFVNFFAGIEKYLVKNVYVMRIMDLNGSHGSHFINTVQYASMERDIQEAINYEKNKLNIDDNNVVLYGASKGGTGALLHGSALDYKVLAVDPIINLSNYNKTDYHFLKDLRTVDLTEKIGAELKKCYRFEKYLICSPQVKFNYSYAKELGTHSLVRMVVLNDEHIKKHADVSKNSVPEQLLILNQLLSGIC